MVNTKPILISGDNEDGQLASGKILQVYAADTSQGLLRLSSDESLGKVWVMFISKTHSEYRATFNKNSNEYRLLDYLANHPNQLFTAKYLSNHKVLKEPRDMAGDDYDRRLRDSIRQLRVKLKLEKHNPDDPFVSSNGFGLFCKVERDW